MPARTRSTAGSIGSATTPELPPLIVVAGATATGKTSLAITLATEIDGAEIVSADSRQVYRGMDIGTAKATRAERAAVPHHCLDLVDPDERFTASDFRRHALAALRGIAARDGVALLVGGTGLYLRAIGRGLPLDRGDSDAGVRTALERRHHEAGLDALVAELLKRDPDAAAKLDLRNPRRVIRALERAMLTGSAAPPEPQGYAAPSFWLGLRHESEAHRALIEARVRKQFETGLLDEAGRLRSRYGEDLQAFSAMGYREAFDVLAHRDGVEPAMARDAQRTWIYARRQRTWFRSEPGIAWLESGMGVADRARAAIGPFLRQIGDGDYAGRE